MTHYQSTGRNQRPRGLRVKQALQFTLILAIGIWLLYQIKPSHNENKNQGQSTWNKLREEGRTLVLGRKGKAAWSSDRSDSGSKGAHSVEENDAVDGGHTGNEKKDVTVESYGGKTDIVVRDETGKFGIDLVLDSEKAVRENDTDELSTEIESGSTLQQNGMVNETFSGHWEMEDGEHSFHDETGVPQDLEKDYQKINFHHSSISSNIRSEMSESKAIPRHNVESKQGKFVEENKDDGTTEDPESDIKPDAGSSTSKIMQVKSKDSDVSQIRYSR